MPDNDTHATGTPRKDAMAAAINTLRIDGPLREVFNHATLLRIAHDFLKLDPEISFPEGAVSNDAAAGALDAAISAMLLAVADLRIALTAGEDPQI